jgi:WD40 repeat protein
VWDVDTGQEIPTFGDYPAGVTSLALLPGTDTVFTGLDSGYVRSWNLQTGEGEQIGERGATTQAAQIALSPDGHTIAYGGQNWSSFYYDVVLWDLTSHQSVGDFSVESGNVAALAFSPVDNTVLAAAGIGIKIWNTTTETALPRGQMNLDWSNQTTALAFSPDGKTLVSGDISGQVRLWDAHTGALLSKLQETDVDATHPYGHLSNLIFSPDGTMIVYGGSSEIKFWDAVSGSLLFSLPKGGFETAVAFSPDGALLASLNDNQLELWDVHSHEKLTSIERPNATHLAFSSDGRYIVTGGYDGLLRVWGVPGN